MNAPLNAEPPASASDSQIAAGPRSTERVPLPAKMAWALGSLGDNYASQMLPLLAAPVFNLGLGLPFEKLQAALALPRWLDSFAEPTVGYLSDNSQTRWGRRRPFIFIGAICLAIMAFCLWLPGARWSHAALAWYVTGASLLYYLAYALFIVPYRALGFELTRDYHERTRVQGWGMIFGLVGGQLLPWLPKLALLFGGGDSGAAMDNPQAILIGARWVGLCVAVIILVTCAAPALFCREKMETAKQQKISIPVALKETLRNWPFLNMLLSRTFALISTFAVMAFSAPLAVHFLFAGHQSDAYTLIGLSGNALLTGAGIGIPINTWISTKIGKRHAFIVCLGIAGAGTLSQLITYQPGHPYWTLGSQFLFGFGIQGVWLMCQSIVADVCDEDQLRTGRRREGIYGAAYALVEKLAITAGTILAGTVAAICGYSAGIPSPQTLHNLWLATICLPLAGMAISAVLIAFYPLTQHRMLEIRKQLDRRNPADG